MAAGFDWVPSPNAKGLFKRATYKFGGYYSNSYATADQTGKITDKPKEFGLSAGLSLPLKSRWLIFPDNQSRLNLSVQWVHTDIPYLSTATNRQSNLTENYLKVCVGMTINECWFYKWKLR